MKRAIATLAALVANGCSQPAHQDAASRAVAASFVAAARACTAPLTANGHMAIAG